MENVLEEDNGKEELSKLSGNGVDVYVNRNYCDKWKDYNFSNFSLHDDPSPNRIQKYVLLTSALLEKGQQGWSENKVYDHKSQSWVKDPGNEIKELKVKLMTITASESNLFHISKDPEYKDIAEKVSVREALQGYVSSLKKDKIDTQVSVPAEKEVKDDSSKIGKISILPLTPENLAKFSKNLKQPSAGPAAYSSICESLLSIWEGKTEIYEKIKNTDIPDKVPVYLGDEGAEFFKQVADMYCHYYAKYLLGPDGGLQGLLKNNDFKEHEWEDYKNKLKELKEDTGFKKFLEMGQFYRQEEGFEGLSLAVQKLQSWVSAIAALDNPKAYPLITTDAEPDSEMKETIENTKGLSKEEREELLKKGRWIETCEDLLDNYMQKVTQKIKRSQLEESINKHADLFKKRINLDKLFAELFLKPLLIASGNYVAGKDSIMDQEVKCFKEVFKRLEKLNEPEGDELEKFNKPEGDEETKSFNEIMEGTVKDLLVSINSTASDFFEELMDKEKEIGTYPSYLSCIYARIPKGDQFETLETKEENFLRVKDSWDQFKLLVAGIWEQLWLKKEVQLEYFEENLVEDAQSQSSEESEDS